MNLYLVDWFGEVQTFRLVSRMALRELNAVLAIAVYRIFEDEKSKGFDKNRSTKNCNKKGHRAYIIAKNFVWEQQLIIVSKFHNK